MGSRRKKDAKLRSVYSRKGVWYIRFTVDGREYRESSKSTDQDVALAFLEKRRNEVIEGKVVGPSPRRTTFDDLVGLIEQDYASNGRKSIASLRYRIARLKAAFGKTPPIEITHKVLESYVAKRLAEGASPATVRYELVVLGRMFTLAIEAELLTTKPPLPTVKIRNVRKGFFEADEIGGVLKQLPGDIAPAIEFAYYTGWRIGEIRRLTWTNHLDLDAGVVRLERGETKNEEGRTFPFAEHPRLGALILAQMERTVALQRERGRDHPVGPLARWRTAWRVQADLGQRLP